MCVCVRVYMRWRKTIEMWRLIPSMHTHYSNQLVECVLGGYCWLIISSSGLRKFKWTEAISNLFLLWRLALLFRAAILWWNLRGALVSSSPSLLAVCMQRENSIKSQLAFTETVGSFTWQCLGYTVLAGPWAWTCFKCGQLQGSTHTPPGAEHRRWRFGASERALVWGSAERGSPWPSFPS